MKWYRACCRFNTSAGGDERRRMETATAKRLQFLQAASVSLQETTPSLSRHLNSVFVRLLGGSASSPSSLVMDARSEKNLCTACGSSLLLPGLNSSVELLSRRPIAESRGRRRKGRLLDRLPEGVRCANYVVHHCHCCSARTLLPGEPRTDPVIASVPSMSKPSTTAVPANSNFQGKSKSQGKTAKKRKAGGLQDLLASQKKKKDQQEEDPAASRLSLNDFLSSL